MSQALPLEHLALVGLSHRTAPFDVLERLALSPEEIQALYDKLRGYHAQSALVLSTCNRTEVYAVGEQAPQALVDEVARALREVVGEARFPKDAAMYTSSGSEGAKHLFRVACGLDSMILGEAQILGQLKEAFEHGADALPPAPIFDRVMQSAFRVGARTRTETDIGRGAVSVASAAVHLATRVYGDLSRCNIVIVGAGETGRLLAQHLANHGPARLTVVNRTLARAEALAREVGGHAAELSSLQDLLADAHIVGTAVRSSTPILTRAMLAQARGDADASVLAVLDLGLPRNVAPDAQGLANVFVHDLTALEKIVDANLARRRKAVPQVETLIDAEVTRLSAWQQTREAGPLIAALREAVESVRAAEVDKATRGMSASEREAVERVTRAVVNKLLHGPMTSIKESARRDDGETRLKVIHEVFKGLGSGDDKKNA